MSRVSPAGTADTGCRHRRIETLRLYLRAWQSSDLRWVQAILGDPEVMAFSDRGVLGEREQAEWLQRAATTAPRGGLPGNLAIERKDDGQVIGYVSLTCDPKRIGPGEAEIGFRLAKEAWNRGFATEAAGAMLDAATAHDGTDRIVAIVDPNNRRSVHVVQKLGMTVAGDILFDGYDYPDHVYARQIG